MHRFLALAALTAAMPAAAQQIDTGVEDVAETSDGFTCRPHAIPELRMSHDWRGGDRAAAWDLPSRDTAAGDLRLRVSFRWEQDAPNGGVVASVSGFGLDLDRTPLRAAAQAAHLRIDGKPDPLQFRLEGDRNALSLAVPERQRDELAARFMSASIIEIDLVDAAATPLARFSWDVRGLRRARELLQAVNWSCR